MAKQYRGGARQFGVWQMKWKKGAHRELRSSSEVQSKLEAIAGRIANEANQGLDEPGYLTGSQQGQPKGTQGRWRTSVVTGTAEAMADDARHDTLAKLLEGESL